MKRAPLAQTAFVLACLSFATAGSTAARVSRPELQPDLGLQERIDIELREADVKAVLASFGHIFGGETEIDPAIAGEVTIELHHVRAATVLTAVCESVGCLWRIEDGRLEIEKDPEFEPRPGASGQAEGPSAARLDELIDMELVDADLRETLRSFGAIVQARAEIDPKLEEKVTVQLQDTPVRTALDAICRIEGCRWELVEEDEGPVLRFSATR
jgi:type II secretory pathway component GspD/PulD (secretin)